MNAKIEFQIGDIVRSLQGRDEKTLYVVKEILAKDHLALVDGKKHKFEKPKRKNQKHVKHVASEKNLAEQIISKKIVQDAQIRNILKGEFNV